MSLLKNIASTPGFPKVRRWCTSNLQKIIHASKNYQRQIFHEPLTFGNMYRLLQITLWYSGNVNVGYQFSDFSFKCRNLWWRGSSLRWEFWLRLCVENMQNNFSWLRVNQSTSQSEFFMRRESWLVVKALTAFSERNGRQHKKKPCVNILRRWYRLVARIFFSGPRDEANNKGNKPAGSGNGYQSSSWYSRGWCIAVCLI